MEDSKQLAVDEFKKYLHELERFKRLLYVDLVDPLKNLVEDIPNDQELGEAVRAMLKDA